jgi:hypothetical protein
MLLLSLRWVVLTETELNEEKDTFTLPLYSCPVLE